MPPPLFSESYSLRSTVYGLLSMQMITIDFNPTHIFGPADLEQLPPRSPGLHLSDIYHDLEDTIATKKRDPMPLAQLQNYRAGGFMWEHLMDRALATALAHDGWERPGEFSRDGITGSPDLIATEPWVLGETKCTWKSCRRWDAFEDEFWIWLVQMKAYCHLIGTDRARLFTLFINGDYKNGYQPQTRAADFVFSPAELRDNWSMLINHARKRQWL